jgi:hypothetical protein
LLQAFDEENAGSRPRAAEVYQHPRLPIDAAHLHYDLSNSSIHSDIGT